MRLWSIHPKYLDTKGLVALWREALLAKAVLEGKTKGYTKHPQLKRFRNWEKPLGAINCFLECVYREAVKRGFGFDKKKFKSCPGLAKIPVTSGQLKYEYRHLQNKLKIREHTVESTVKCQEGRIMPNLAFVKRCGGVEPWEKKKRPLSGKAFQGKGFR